jgi:hypothetical protein
MRVTTDLNNTFEIINRIMLNTATCSGDVVAIAEQMVIL